MKDVIHVQLEKLLRAAIPLAQSTYNLHLTPEPARLPIWYISFATSKDILVAHQLANVSIWFASSTVRTVSLPILSTSHILAVNAVPSIFNLILSQPAAILAAFVVSSINNLVLLPIPSKSHSQ